MRSSVHSDKNPFEQVEDEENVDVEDDQEETVQRSRTSITSD